MAAAKGFWLASSVSMMAGQVGEGGVDEGAAGGEDAFWQRGGEAGDDGGAVLHQGFCQCREMLARDEMGGKTGMDAVCPGHAGTGEAEIKP